jgi:hypothetical protein
MAIDSLFAQITHEAPSASWKETPLLAVCCLCRLIRDEIGASPDRARWVTQRTYQKTHGVNPVDCLQTHTYCPWCFTQARETIRAAQGHGDTDGRLARGQEACLGKVF